MRKPTVVDNSCGLFLYLNFSTGYSFKSEDVSIIDGALSRRVGEASRLRPQPQGLPGHYPGEHYRASGTAGTQFLVQPSFDVYSFCFLAFEIFLGTTRPENPNPYATHISRHLVDLINAGNNYAAPQTRPSMSKLAQAFYAEALYQRLKQVLTVGVRASASSPFGFADLKLCVTGLQAAIAAYSNFNGATDDVAILEWIGGVYTGINNYLRSFLAPEFKSSNFLDNLVQYQVIDPTVLGISIQKTAILGHSYARFTASAAAACHTTG